MYQRNNLLPLLSLLRLQRRSRVSIPPAASARHRLLILPVPHEVAQLFGRPVSARTLDEVVGGVLQPVQRRPLTPRRPRRQARLFLDAGQVIGVFGVGREYRLSDLFAGRVVDRVVCVCCCGQRHRTGQSERGAHASVGAYARREHGTVERRRR